MNLIRWRHCSLSNPGSRKRNTVLFLLLFFSHLSLALPSLDGSSHFHCSSYGHHRGEPHCYLLLVVNALYLGGGSRGAGPQEVGDNGDSGLRQNDDNDKLQRAQIPIANSKGRRITRFMVSVSDSGKSELGREWRH